MYALFEDFNEILNFEKDILHGKQTQRERIYFPVQRRISALEKGVKKVPDVFILRLFFCDRLLFSMLGGTLSIKFLPSP